MRSIFFRELKSLFTTPLGYALLGVFFIVNGLVLWVFPGPWNILEAKFADVNLFFELNPWLLLFLLPALGMKAFAEEMKSGTLDLLFSKPISINELIFGKFLSLFCLAFISISISAVYFYVLNPYTLPLQHLDWGVYLGSLFGLSLLCASFLGISLWASTLVYNTFTAFVLALLVSLFLFLGWNQLAELFSDYSTYRFIKSLSLQYHYSELSKGIIRLSNVFYLVGQSLFFLYWTRLNLQQYKQ